VLETIYKDNQFKERVVFLGRKTPTELRELTNLAKFGINLLENKGLNYYYSLANKFFDFIQAGVIPISMNFPEYRRIQDKYNCAILLDGLEESKYIDSIQEVLLNENKYSELVKNCDIAASFLTWESQEEKLCSIYKNV
jgi:glycosyltransferase involved in cell wall biosynthesis